MYEPAILVLADGSVFSGKAIGAMGATVGEVVFNTAMSGYQEMLTDPSYAQQILSLTCPHIGNVGCNEGDTESEGIHAAGLVIRDLPTLRSSWRGELSLSAYLKQQNIVGISDIDTRHLTRILREKGAQAGCIMAGECDEQQALQAARDFTGLQGCDMAQQVTTVSRYTWLSGSWQWQTDSCKDYTEAELPHHVVAYDFGVKRNILRLLVDQGCRVTVVPAKTPAEAVLALAPDGVFLSNGPGDPEPCDYAIQAIQTLLASNTPLFGICLGHQLLALACGAKTQKMKFGHHGANHPVQELATGKVMISCQNHGFTVDEASLPNCLRATHRSLFDGSLQGIAHQQKLAFSFQGHPEASPGPHELAALFAQFRQLMIENSHA